MQNIRPYSNLLYSEIVSVGVGGVERWETGYPYMLSKDLKGHIASVLPFWGKVPVGESSGGKRGIHTCCRLKRRYSFCSALLGEGSCRGVERWEMGYPYMLSFNQKHIQPRIRVRVGYDSNLEIYNLKRFLSGGRAVGNWVSLRAVS